MRMHRHAVMGLVCVMAACQGRSPETAAPALAAPPSSASNPELQAKIASPAVAASSMTAPPVLPSRDPAVAPVLPSAETSNLGGALKFSPAQPQLAQQQAGLMKGSMAGDALGGAQGLASLGAGGGGTGSVGIGGLGTRGRGGGAVGYGYGSGSGSAMSVRRSSGAVGHAFAGAAAAEPAGSEDYGATRINAWTLTEQDHLSTFAADVDTASYTLGRRKLLTGALPPKDSVRVEEWLNYFRYDLPRPAKDAPLAVTLDAAPSPFTPHRTLLRVGVQGKVVDLADRKPAHLTFLVDVSGSMSGPDRLPLAQRSLRMLVDQFHDGDTVALVTYAGNVRLVLPPTGMQRKAFIHAAIEELTAGGSTGMSSGIELAYQQALRTLDSRSTSRVIVLSDGDANVGATSHEAILDLIAGHVKEGITVTTVGFGMGNYKSALMEQFADKGNGNHFYVDSLMAAKRIFVEQLGGTLEVIAQDVKLQVDFDPAQVNGYRLVGYENRDLADQDFRNDKVDAGEIGSGHRVTALYELDLKEGAGDGLATVRVRAKKPRGVEATERAFAFSKSALAPRFEDASKDLRFVVAVMGAAEILRQSPGAAEWSLAQVLSLARAATTPGDAEREEFLHLLEVAQKIARPVAAR